MKKIIALFTVLVVIVAALWVALNHKVETSNMAKFLEYKDGEIQRTTTINKDSFAFQNKSRVYLDGKLISQNKWKNIDFDIVKAIRLETFSATDSNLINLTSTDFTYLPKVVEPLVTFKKGDNPLYLHILKNTSVIDLRTKGKKSTYKIQKLISSKEMKQQNISNVYANTVVLTLSSHVPGVGLKVNNTHYGDYLREHKPILDLRKVKEIVVVKERFFDKEYDLLNVVYNEKINAPTYKWVKFETPKRQ